MSPPSARRQPDSRHQNRGPFWLVCRGEARVDSDIDLRLEVDREHGFGLFALSAFGEAVRKETGRQVDLVSSDHLNSDLAAAIEREGVIVYDRA